MIYVANREFGARDAGHFLQARCFLEIFFVVVSLFFFFDSTFNSFIQWIDCEFHGQLDFSVSVEILFMGLVLLCVFKIQKLFRRYPSKIRNFVYS